MNVPPVMPILAERLYLLDILHQKINKGKYLLWLAQKEGSSYKKIRDEWEKWHVGMACGGVKDRRF